MKAQPGGVGWGRDGGLWWGEGRKVGGWAVVDPGFDEGDFKRKMVSAKISNPAHIGWPHPFTY